MVCFPSTLTLTLRIKINTRHKGQSECTVCVRQCAYYMCVIFCSVAVFPIWFEVFLPAASLSVANESLSTFIDFTTTSHVKSYDRTTICLSFEMRSVSDLASSSPPKWLPVLGWQTKCWTPTNHIAFFYNSCNLNCKVTVSLDNTNKYWVYEWKQTLNHAPSLSSEVGYFAVGRNRWLRVWAACVCTKSDASHQRKMVKMLQVY